MESFKINNKIFTFTESIPASTNAHPYYDIIKNTILNQLVINNDIDQINWYAILSYCEFPPEVSNVFTYSINKSTKEGWNEDPLAFTTMTIQCDNKSVRMVFIFISKM